MVNNSVKMFFSLQKYFFVFYHAKVVNFFEKILNTEFFFCFFSNGEKFFNKKSTTLFLHKKKMYICKPFEVK